MFNTTAKKSDRGFSMPLLIIALLTAALAGLVLWYVNQKNQDNITAAQNAQNEVLDTTEKSASESITTEDLTVVSKQDIDEFTDADLDTLDAQMETVTQDYNDSFSDIQ